MRKEKTFDGADLNKCFPGKKNGNCAQQFGKKKNKTKAYNILNKIIKKFEYLLDIKTAGFGRVNSLFVKCNMKDKITHRMALLQNVFFN
jgi:uncharacterized protein